MHVRSRLWLTILSLFLTLWLISGFLPLSAVNQIILTLVSVVVPVLKRRWDVTPAIIRAVEYLSRVPVSH